MDDQIPRMSGISQRKIREKESELEEDFESDCELCTMRMNVEMVLAKENFAQQNGPEQILCLLLIIPSKEQG